MGWRRQIVLGHRWLGIALSLLFVMWFVSGVVMMYVPYPSPDDNSRIAGQSPISVASECCIDREIVPEIGERLRLRMVGDVLYIGSKSRWESMHDGTPLSVTQRDDARSTVENFLWARSDFSRIEDVELRFNDQWTVAQRYDPYRPLFRVALNDNRWIYVSTGTGEIVLETTRSQRVWNWLGSVVHWIYFTPVRANPRLWAELIIWVSVICILVAVAGFWVGLRQYRPKRRRLGRSALPYTGVSGVHHVTGLVFGTFVISFMVSGLLSVSPWGLFSSEGITVSDHRMVHGSPERLTVNRVIDGLHSLQHTMPEFDIREAEVFGLDGNWWIRVRDGKNQRIAELESLGTHKLIPSERMENVAGRLAGELRESDRHWLQSPDLYYYSRQGDLNFPVLRIRLRGGNAPWYYLDPESGGIARKTDSAGRRFRWWFNALHSLDFPWLLRSRPTWDLVLIVLSIGGTIVSISGVIIGWRRLRFALRPRSQATR